MSNTKEIEFVAPEVVLIAKSEMLYPNADVPYPTDDVAMVGKVASVCYGEKSDRLHAIARGCVARGHESVTEHLSYTFKIKGMSRACAQQLTRHRMASYTMESQRYTDQGEATYSIPDSIAQDPAHAEIYASCINMCQKTYDYLRGQGVKSEDARGILPICATTTLYVTMNVRELRHFFKLRMAPDAQAEIRYVAQQMYSAIVDEYASRWSDYGRIFDLIGKPSKYNIDDEWEIGD